MGNGIPVVSHILHRGCDRSPIIHGEVHDELLDGATPRRCAEIAPSTLGPVLGSWHAPGGSLMPYNVSTECDVFALVWTVVGGSTVVVRSISCVGYRS
jgi:hypothetical protein